MILRLQNFTYDHTQRSPNIMPEMFALSQLPVGPLAHWPAPLPMSSLKQKKYCHVD